MSLPANATLAFSSTRGVASKIKILMPCAAGGGLDLLYPPDLGRS
jgi:hypothetical protein